MKTPNLDSISILKLPNIDIGFLLVTVILFFVACEKEPSTPNISEEDQLIEARTDHKIDLCHYSEEEDTWKLINISERAWLSHKAHGDVRLDDQDGDGFVPDNACGFGAMGDCDDQNGAVHPNAAEVCDNNIDDNCDGHVDEADSSCPDFSVGIIGSATPLGWDQDIDMTYNGDGGFIINLDLEAGEVKFRADDSWHINWGGFDWPEGFGFQDGPNIHIPVSGSYSVTFYPSTGYYLFSIQLSFASIGIIGDATPLGWDEDTNMIDNGDGTFSLSIHLEAGGFKFRADDSWDFNWGGVDWPSGVATLDGPVMNVPTAGTYNITFTPETGEYIFD